MDNLPDNNNNHNYYNNYCVVNSENTNEGQLAMQLDADQHDTVVFRSPCHQVTNDSALFQLIFRLGYITTLILTGTIVGPDAVESFIALFQGDEAPVKHLVIYNWRSLSGAYNNEALRRGWTSHSYRIFVAAFKSQESQLLSLNIHVGPTTFGTLIDYLSSTPACLVIRLAPACQTVGHLEQILKALLVNYKLGKGRNTAEKVLLFFKKAITIQYVNAVGFLIPNAVPQATIQTLANIIDRNNTTGEVARYKALLKQRDLDYKAANFPNDQGRKRPRFHARANDL